MISEFLVVNKGNKMKFVHLNHLCQTTFTELSTIMTLLVFAMIIHTAKVTKVTVMPTPVDTRLKNEARRYTFFKPREIS